MSIYALNQNYPLREEIESIVRKTIGVEIELKKRLHYIDGIEFAFLFGSYVKGGLKSDSDIDLFMIGSPTEVDIIRALEDVGNITREIKLYFWK